MKHVGDSKREVYILPGIKGGVDAHWHGPANEWYHAHNVGYVEVIEGSPSFNVHGATSSAPCSPL